MSIAPVCGQIVKDADGFWKKVQEEFVKRNFAILKGEEVLYPTEKDLKDALTRMAQSLKTSPEVSTFSYGFLVVEVREHSVVVRVADVVIKTYMLTAP